jgi:hypothetical protein
MGSKKYIDFEHLPGMIEPKLEKGVTEKKDDGFQILDLDF